LVASLYTTLIGMADHLITSFHVVKFKKKEWDKKIYHLTN